MAEGGLQRRAPSSCSMKLGINGFGRIGRGVFRALWGRNGSDLVYVNKPAGDAHAAAHRLVFDSVHGRWNQAVNGNSRGVFVGTTPVSNSLEQNHAAGPRREAGVELVRSSPGDVLIGARLSPRVNDALPYPCGVQNQP